MRARASDAALRRIDQAAATIAPDEPRLREWHDRYARQQRERLALDLDLVEQHAPIGAAVLDVGAVPLLLTAALTARGYDTRACDLAPERYSTSIAVLGLAVSRCNIETERLPYDDGAFALVVFNELFEHLRVDPIFTLSEVLRVLAPGGVLLLSTPNLRSLTGIRNFVFRNRAQSCAADPYTEFSKLAALGHMGHVREYTTVEVSSFLTAIGFRVGPRIFRGSYRSALARAVVAACHPLSPFVTFVASKP
jgi:SAM-dependent methyltransferase